LESLSTFFFVPSNQRQANVFRPPPTRQNQLNLVDFLIRLEEFNPLGQILLACELHIGYYLSAVGQSANGLDCNYFVQLAPLPTGELPAGYKK
jgi:hypothetical protein